MHKIKLALLLLLTSPVLATDAAAQAADKGQSSREMQEEYGKKYLPHRNEDVGMLTARPCDFCELEKALLSEEAKAQPSKFARKLTLYVLLKTMEVKELVPDLTIDQGNRLQRKLFRKFIAKNPSLTQDFGLVNGLKTVELALSNYDEYDKLFAVNLKNHEKTLKTDLVCYSFLHKAFLPAKRLNKSPDQAFADLAAQYDSCQQSKAISYFKDEAQRKYRCLKAVGRPFASYAEFEQLYRSQRCRGS